VEAMRFCGRDAMPRNYAQDCNRKKLKVERRKNVNKK
jgi:hypothetical protein